MSLRPVRSHRASFLVACFTAVVAPLAAAQTPPIRPGLWEVHSEREVNGQKAAPPADRMKNLPPEARAKMEAMMKQRGIAVGGDGATRVCLTKDSIASGKLQAEAAGCKTDYSTRTSSVWKFHSSCPAMKVESEGELVFSSADSYTMTVSSTLSSSTPPRLSKTTMNGKWLGASCGDLQPLSAKP
ncbi:MAG: DUF3617 domain-containing protein [Caldimonas sp.]